MKVADCLSRAPLEDSVPEISDAGMKYYIHSVINSVPISKKKMNEFKSETAKDKALCKLTEYIENGWPDKKAVDKIVFPYRSIRNELSTHDGIVLRGNRIVVPNNMRKEIKSQLHTGHMGIEKCINRAKLTVYWPNLNKEIEDLVSNCNACITYRNAQQQEMLIEHEVPGTPWDKVGIDLFSLYSREYLNGETRQDTEGQNREEK